MARILPFAALRYNETLSADASVVCCPPYDIIPIEEQAKLEAKSPYNVVQLERPLGEDCYRRAGDLLRRWRRDGVLVREDCPAFYVYRMDFTDSAQGGKERSVYGFFARVGLEPFSRGVVLPHEETLSKDITDRYALMSETLCNISPVYGLYADRKGIADETLKIAMAPPPLVSFTDEDGVTHSLWTITAPLTCEALTRVLSDARILIADGHHRYETALAFHEDCKRRTPSLPDDSPLGTVLMFLVEMGHPDLVVWPTHRLVRGLPDFSADTLLASLTREFDMETAPASADLPAILSQRPRTVGLYNGGDTVTLLTLRDPATVRRRLPDRSDAYCSLEVTLLHACILEPYLGIDKEKLASQTNLVYTRDIGEAYDKVRAGTVQCAFLLPPAEVSMIGRVADQGERMPQKSTYFFPKLTTGLVIHSLEDM